MSLPFEEGVDLIISAHKGQQEERLWDLYASLYPWMDKESFETFEDFTDRMTGTNISQTPGNEILDMARRIEESVKGR